MFDETNIFMSYYYLLINAKLRGKNIYILTFSVFKTNKKPKKIDLKKITFLKSYYYLMHITRFNIKK